MARVTAVVFALMLGALGSSACTPDGGNRGNGADDGADSLPVTPLDRAALEVNRSDVVMRGVRYGNP